MVFPELKKKIVLIFTWGSQWLMEKKEKRRGTFPFWRQEGAREKNGRMLENNWRVK